MAFHEDDDVVEEAVVAAVLWKRWDADGILWLLPS